MLERIYWRVRHGVNRLLEAGGFLESNVTDGLLDKTLKSSIGDDTITSSGKRSSYEDWWNDESEDIYTRYGFKELNRMYGCEQPPDVIMSAIIYVTELVDPVHGSKSRAIVCN